MNLPERILPQAFDGKVKGPIIPYMSQPLAYLDPTFMESEEARPLRILAEYSEPLSRFRAQNIQDTVVFFGSARIRSRQDAEHSLRQFKPNGDAFEASVAQLDMTTYSRYQAMNAIVAGMTKPLKRRRSSANSSDWCRCS